MAYKNYKKKVYKKYKPKSYRKYKKKFAITHGVRTSGFPPYVYCKLKYSHPIALTIDSGTPGYQIFKANSLNDPVYAAGGGQPLYYDQYSAVYTYYTVFACKATVQLATNTTNMDTAVMMMWHNRPDECDSTITQDKCAERPNTIVRYISNEKPAKIQMFKKISQVAGVQSAKVKLDDAYSAYITADPANVVYVSIIGESADEITSSDVMGHIKLVYYCKMWRRLIPSRS